MIVAVKFYKDLKDAPKGMPALFPAEVLENFEGHPEGYRLMTAEMMERYKQRYMAEYLAYEEKAGLKKALMPPSDAPKAPINKSVLILAALNLLLAALLIIKL
jgi:hypothetical protein